MTRYIGIDYGAKNIGIAVSDEDGSIAFPHSIIINDDTSMRLIKELAQEEGIQTLVVGAIMNGGSSLHHELQSFASLLASQGFDVVFQDESMTSVHIDSFTKTKPIARQVARKREPKRDDSAAALILQRFLDTRKKV